MLTCNVTKKQMIANLRAVIDMIENDSAYVRMRAESEPQFIEVTKITDPIPKPKNFTLTIEVEKF